MSFCAVYVFGNDPLRTVSFHYTSTWKPILAHFLPIRSRDYTIKIDNDSDRKVRGHVLHSWLCFFDGFMGDI